MHLGNRLGFILNTSRYSSNASFYYKKLRLYTLLFRVWWSCFNDLKGTSASRRVQILSCYFSVSVRLLLKGPSGVQPPPSTRRMLPQLFIYFFVGKSVIQELCGNTNKRARNTERGRNFTWMNLLLYARRSITAVEARHMMFWCWCHWWEKTVCGLAMQDRKSVV